MNGKKSRDAAIRRASDQTRKGIIVRRGDTERPDAICVESVSADQLEAGDMVLAGDRPHVLVGDREMHYQGADPPTIWLGDFRDKGVVDGWGQIWRVVRDTDQEPER